jgi:membrane protein DedA with SNARE-associated domain
VLHHDIQFLVRHGYAIIFCAVLAEQGAIPVPTIPLLLAYGAIARAGKLNVFVAILAGLAGCLIADNVWFQLGRSKGGRVLRLICRISLEPDTCVRRTEDAFAKRGLKSLLIAKFVPGLNAVAAPMAGGSGVRWRNFLGYDAAGAILWLGAYIGLGYFLGDQLELVADYALRMGSWLLVLIVALIAAWLLWKYLQRRRTIRELSMARISPAELREMLDANEDVMIVDLRPRLEWDDNELPGVLRLAPEELLERSDEIPRDREIVLLCL